MHENRVLTDCDCAGSDGQGVMGDVRRDIQLTCGVECTQKESILTVCGCAGSDGQGVMKDVRRNIKYTRRVDCRRK